MREENNGTVTPAMNPHHEERPIPGEHGSRSATLLENLLRDLRYAMRGFIRAPVAAFTIIATLGLGLLAAVYTILNSMVFRADEVYNPHELFGVERQRSAISEIETFTLAEYDTFLRETEVFADAFASTGDVRAFIDGVRREGRVVTGNFFQVLVVSAARGRTFAPSDDDPASPPVIVLSHRAWVQQYDSDPGAIDRACRLNGMTFRVIGVMPEGFRGLEVLAPRLGTVPRPAEAMVAFMPLLFAFGLILMIGCANVANLLLARLV